MLADAVFAETYRLARSRTTWFWSVFFVPVMGLVFSVIGNVFLKANADKLLADGKAPPEVALMLNQATVDIGQALVHGAGELAGPVTLLFVLIGATTIYAGDYRWETWRLISARNSRVNLLLGKIGVLKILVLAAMAVMLVGLIGENLLKAAIMAKPLTFTFSGEDFGRLAGFLLLSFWRIIQFMMIALLTAVMTRSLLAALFVPLVVGVAQFFSMQVLAPMGVTPEDWVAVMLNPGAAADAIKALISGGPSADSLPDGLVLKAFVSQLFWMFAPLVGAVAWFRRQDLSKE